MTDSSQSPQSISQQNPSREKQIVSLRNATNVFFKNREFKHGIMLVASSQTVDLFAKGILNDPSFGLLGSDASLLLTKNNE